MEITSHPFHPDFLFIFFKDVALLWLCCGDHTFVSLGQCVPIGTQIFLSHQWSQEKEGPREKIKTSKTDLRRKRNNFFSLSLILLVVESEGLFLEFSSQWGNDGFSHKEASKGKQREADLKSPVEPGPEPVGSENSRPSTWSIQTFHPFPRTQVRL